MSERIGLGWARGIGFLMGVAAAFALLLSWRVPGGDGRLGADVLVAAASTGEIAVARPGPLLSATGMSPGSEAAAGSLTIYNRSPLTMSVHVKAVPSNHDLDDLLWVSIEANGDNLYRGPLGTLSEGTPNGFLLAPGDGRDLSISAWLPTSAGSGYEARIASIDLTFDTTPVGSR